MIISIFNFNKSKMEKKLIDKCPSNNIKYKELNKLFSDHGYSNYCWIDPKKIVVSQWVRMKCMFGCEEYGKNCCCPPNIPSVSECRTFFYEYSTAVIFQFTKRVDRPEDRHLWTKDINLKLLELERATFLAGFERAFLLFMDSCTICKECVGKKELCRNPKSARPGPESMAMDVFSTVKQYKFPISVRTDYSQEMNRYSFLLID